MGGRVLDRQTTYDCGWFGGLETSNRWVLPATGASVKLPATR
jgi:hypothetical protein